MLLGRKLISPGDTRKFTVDYTDWLDTTETVSTKSFSIDTGPATIASSSIAADGKSVSFLVTGAVIGTLTFNVQITITTSGAQTKVDHIEFDVVAS